MGTGADGRNRLRLRRAAGEGVEIAVEVRLVVVTAVEGHIDGSAAGVEERGGAAEAQEAGKQFRSVARSFETEAAELARAKVGVASQVVQ